MKNINKGIWCFNYKHLIPSFSWSAYSSTMKNFDEGDNMPKYVENTREFRLLSEKISTLTDEFQGKVNRQNVVNFVKKEVKGVRPEGFVNDLIDNGFVTEENGVIIFPINKKGGEKVDKKKTSMTSGEDKVAKAILDHFETGFKAGRTPSEMVFKNCLKTSLKSINKKVDARLAFKKMIDNDYITIIDGKIQLGVNGKDYLSL